MLPVKDLITLLYRHAGKEPLPVTFSKLASWVVIAPYLGWHTMKLSNLLGYKDDIQFVMRNVMGSKMLLDLQDSGISRDLLTSPCREVGLTGWWQENIKPGMVEFDVGANIGYYALQAAQLVGDSGVVYAIEPVPDNFDLLSKNVRINNYKNVELQRVAFGDHNGECDMYWSGMRNYATLVPGTWRSYTSQFVVPLRTIDRFIADTGRIPDVIRMDTEGYELSILKGALELLSSNRPLKLALEVHFELLGKERAVYLLDMLKRYNFKVEATFYEPHPAIQEHKLGMKMLSKCVQGFGATMGRTDMQLDDLYNKKYIAAQIEDVEIIFTRG
jgi:FkbM family methyltransferase